jgi:sec-independent protein translocase protein TatB
VFDIGWSEMAVILLVALVVIGPRDLPRVARTVGKWVAKGRAMAREFQTAIEDMAREAELDKVKSEIEKAGRTNLGKTIENTIDPTGELGQAFDPTAKSRAKPKGDEGAQPGAEPAPPAAQPVEATATPEPVPSEPVSSEPVPGAAPRAEAAAPPASAPSASPKPANGQTADLGPEPPAAGNGSGSKAPERETAPADPS